MAKGQYLPKALFRLVKEVEEAPQDEMAGLVCEYILRLLVAAAKRDREEFRCILNGIEINFWEYYYEETGQDWDEPSQFS